MGVGGTIDAPTDEPTMMTTTPRALAMRAATAVFMKCSSPASVFDPLVDALERAEIAEQRLAEERKHHAALAEAAHALRHKGVNPITWSALKRALSGANGQRELLAGVGTPRGA